MQNRIRELRQKKKISQKELASVVDVTQGMISSFEIGKYEISAEQAAKMADYFDVSMDYLFCRAIAESQEENEQLSKEEKIILDEYRDLNDAGKSLLRETLKSYLKNGALIKINLHGSASGA